MIDANASDGLPFVTRAWGWFLFRGIIALILGVLAIAFPFKVAIVFTAFFATFAFVDGIFSIISGIQGAREKHQRWLSLVLSGIVGIIIGVLFIVWPQASTVAYALVNVLLVASWAAITGAFQIAAAIRMRKEIEGEWLLGLSGALSVALGIGVFIFAMTNPGVSILAVGWMIGLYALIFGAVLVVLAIKLRTLGQRAKTV